ncbi:MAG: Ig-like domain-containing protein [Actinomycetota bacterium]|nr:Ig-like domain-containing protein [Actinomycetota bacterium]
MSGRAAAGRLQWLRPRTGVLLAVAVAACLVLVFVEPAPSQRRPPPVPYGSLPEGYTAEVYGMAYSFLGGVAFVGWSPGSEGNPGTFGNLVANQCTAGHSGLIRWDPSTTELASDGLTPIHPQILPYLPSNTGCGITNSSDGHIYSAIDSGVSVLDGRDGRSLRVIGSPTNTLGIAIDPVTRWVTYLDRSCDRGSSRCIVNQVDPATGEVRAYATPDPDVTTFVDGIAFEPRGEYLFLATREPTWALTVLDRDGELVRQVELPNEPDGIVFHVDPDFALINTTQGNLVSVTFPPPPTDPLAGGPTARSVDYTAAPTVDIFAVGGHRGDLAAAGPDGCMYITQDNTWLAASEDEAFISEESSVIRLCGQEGAFVDQYLTAEPLAAAVTYTGATSGDFNDPAPVSATLTNELDAPIPGAPVTFTLNGAETCTATTDANGAATCTITPREPAGTYPLTASWPGGGGYAPVSATTSFTVTKDETVLTYVGPATLANGRPATLSAVLTDDEGVPLAERAVTLTLGSGLEAQACAGTTDPSGAVTCSLTVDQPLGATTAGAAFAGDDFYEAATVSQPVTVAEPGPFSVTKTARPVSMAAPGGTFTFDVTITNTSDGPITLTSLTDDPYGDLAGRGTCATDGTIAATTGTYSCSFTGEFRGAAGASQTDTVTARGTNSTGGEVTATAQATVRLTAGSPSSTSTTSTSTTTSPTSTTGPSRPDTTQRPPADTTPRPTTTVSSVPTTTAPSTTSAVTTTPVTPDSAGGGGGGGGAAGSPTGGGAGSRGGGSSARPRTGSDPAPALRLGATLLLVGVALLLAASWRREREAEATSGQDRRTPGKQ